MHSARQPNNPTSTGGTSYTPPKLAEAQPKRTNNMPLPCNCADSPAVYACLAWCRCQINPRSPDCRREQVLSRAEHTVHHHAAVCWPLTVTRCLRRQTQQAVLANTSSACAQRHVLVTTEKVAAAAAWLPARGSAVAAAAASLPACRTSCLATAECGSVQTSLHDATAQIILCPKTNNTLRLLC